MQYARAFKTALNDEIYYMCLCMLCSYAYHSLFVTLILTPLGVHLVYLFVSSLVFVAACFFLSSFNKNNFNNRDMNCFAKHFAFDKSVCRFCRQFSSVFVSVHYVVRMSNLFNCVLKKETLSLFLCVRACARAYVCSLMRLFCFVLCKNVSVSLHCVLLFILFKLFQLWLFCFFVLSTASCSSSASTSNVNVNMHVVIHMTLVASLFCYFFSWMFFRLSMFFFVSGCDAKLWTIIRCCTYTHILSKHFTFVIDRRDNLSLNDKIEQLYLSVTLNTKVATTITTEKCTVCVHIVKFKVYRNCYACVCRAVQQSTLHIYAKCKWTLSKWQAHCRCHWISFIWHNHRNIYVNTNTHSNNQHDDWL